MSNFNDTSWLTLDKTAVGPVITEYWTVKINGVSKK
jgi:hypothetical protein